MFSRLLSAYVIERLMRRGRHRRHRGYGYGHGFGRRPRGRGGFVGPFPYYSGRTRRGTRVHVSGCCLPIPIGLLALAASGARLLSR